MSNAPSAGGEAVPSSSSASINFDDHGRRRLHERRLRNSSSSPAAAAAAASSSAPAAADEAAGLVREGLGTAEESDAAAEFRSESDQPKNKSFHAEFRGEMKLRTHAGSTARRPWPIPPPSRLRRPTRRVYR